MRKYIDKASVEKMSNIKLNTILFNRLSSKKFSDKISFCLRINDIDYLNYLNLVFKCAIVVYLVIDRYHQKNDKMKEGW
ncbi:MAG: hypothetical protein PHP11_01905 [Erysipelotrichaceae bacterium]|nr:hypothetical protein [Erysipelotrichaceae bacterium]MDD3923841.1 hypothetical protein [Erysipelotrichaceae bacterium]MDD4642382.1 hypothetical protein [Erysipelotrichaceae bacterium]